MQGASVQNGADLDELLSFTNEELKGRLKPAEVIVDKETLVEATRAQNKALVFIHEKIQSLHGKLDAVEAKFTQRIDEVKDKIEQWGDRVEVLEKKTECHDESFARQEVVNAEVEQFKCETRDALSKTRECIEDLDATVQDLPNTISITTMQVYHARDDHDAENDAPILTIEDSIRHHSERMDEMETHTANEINRVVEWVTDQRKEEESKLNLVKEAVERVEMELKDTISYAEVEEKIAIKVRELVDQIKEALLSVEEDEADFKNVANALHALFNQLKESKADKSEMAQLRNQIINTQLNHQPPETQGSVLDYKGLRKILSSYSKIEMVDRRLDEKAGREFTTKRLNHTESMIDKILETLDELWFVVKRKEQAAAEEGGIVCESGEELLDGNTTTPSDNIRSLVSIEEKNQSKPESHARSRSESFSVGAYYESVSENIPPCANRPRTTMSFQRDSSSIKIDQRPFTSPGNNLSYYITPKNKRQLPKGREMKSRLSVIEPKLTATKKVGELVVSNGQIKPEEEGEEETMGMERRKSSSLQFYEGRATAL